MVNLRGGVGLCLLVAGLLLSAAAVGPAVARNLIANGDFTRDDGQGAPAGWGQLPFPGAPGGSVRLVPRGFRDTQSLVVQETETPAWFGVFSTPADLSRLDTDELLLTFYYKTTGEPNAHVFLAGFPESFVAREWRTPHLQTETQALPAARDWTLFAWHFRVKPGVRDLVTVFELHGAGQLHLGEVTLQTYPTEVICELVSRPGRVLGLPDRRGVELRLTNQAAGDRRVRVAITAQGQERRPVQAATQVSLPRGRSETVRLEYKYEARTPHRLQVVVEDAEGGMVHESLDVTAAGLLEARLVSPAFRQTLLDTLPTSHLEVAGRWNLAPELRRQARVQAELMGASREASFTADNPGSDSEAFRLQAPVPPLLTGQHLVRVTARVGQVEQSVDLPLRRLAPGLPEVAYDHRMRLTMHGRRLLPLGLFGIDDERDLRQAAQAGFNLAVVPARRASYALQEAARETDTAVALLGAELNRSYWQGLQLKWGDSPVNLGWIALSRPDLKGVPVEEVESLYRTLTGLSPNLPVIQPLASLSLAPRYAKAADILVAWSLPVPHAPLRALGDMVDLLSETTQGAQPVWAIIQAACTGMYQDQERGPEESGRPPTAAEMTALAYLALVRGAQGLLWYTYSAPAVPGSPGWRLGRDAPDLWEALPEVLRRLRWLTPVLLEGEREALPPLEEGAVELARWRYQGAEYVCAVNTTDRGRLTPVPLGRPGAQVQVLFENRTLEADAQGEVQESFSPFGVHVYVIE